MTESSLKKATHGPDPGDPALLLEHRITPMAAANALYSEGSDEIAEAIVTSLSRQVFDEQFPAPANRLRRRLAGAVRPQPGAGRPAVQRVSRPHRPPREGALPPAAYLRRLPAACGLPHRAGAGGLTPGMPQKARPVNSSALFLKSMVGLTRAHKT